MFVIMFLIMVAQVCFGLGMFALCLDLLEDNVQLVDWTYVLQLKDRYYIPDDILDEEMRIVSEEGQLWSGHVLDLRDWDKLQFELEVGWSVAETTWVEEADADPSDDGVVLYKGDRTYLPMRREAVVMYELTDPSLMPQPLEGLYKDLAEGKIMNLPFVPKNKIVAEDTMA